MTTITDCRILGGAADTGLLFDLLVPLLRRGLHADLWLENKFNDDMVQIHVCIGHRQQRDESLYICVEKHQLSQGVSKDFTFQIAQ